MSSRLRLSLSLCITLVVLIGITGQGWSAPSDQAGLEVRLGVLLLPNSEGDLAAQLAVQELNDLGFTNPDGLPYRFSLVYPRAYPRLAEDMPIALADLRDQNANAILGPADNNLALPNLEPLARAGVPVLTLATSDALTDFDVTNNIMRLRAAEGFYSRAAADFMVNGAGLTRIVLVQTDIQSTEALLAYDFKLTELGRSAALKIQLENGTTLPDNLPAILEANADAIAMWGSAEDASFLFRELRSRGWTGVFFYRLAQEAMLNGTLNVGNPDGILGANGWSYGNRNALSNQLTLNYVTRYGKIPGDEAAAAYDAVYVLASQVRAVGVEMPALYESLVVMPTVLAVQGELTPQEYGNGDFSRSVNLYHLNPYGAPQILARYRNDVRLPDEALASEPVGAIAAIGTPTFTPSPTIPPTETPIPSATPSQAQLTALAEAVSVYAGPGVFFEELGVLSQGTAATIIGGDANLTWFVIQYRGGIGWVENNQAIISTFDPGGLLAQLPIIEPPPTPIGGASPTPAVELADIVIDNVALTPAQLIPGQPFIANVILRNAGVAPTGFFTIASSFEPGAVFSSNFVQNLESNASITVPLSATLTGTGSYNVSIVADVGNTVNEGQSGEANNIYNLGYRIDYPIATQANSITLPAGGTLDVFGGTADLSWSGSALQGVNGTGVGIVTTATYDNVDYSLLTSGVVNLGALADSQIFPGVLIAIRTAEGKYGILRVDSRDGTSLVLSYRVYGN